MSDLKNEKPETPRTIVENLPRALCEKGLFCNWEYEKDKDGRQTKIPYNPRTNRKAKSNDPATFSDLDTAKRNQDKKPGLGIGIFNNIAGIDIDNCIDAGGVSELAEDIKNTMDTYTEISPSGHGIRLLFTVPEGFIFDSEKYYIKNSKAGIEIYIPKMTNRFLTLTGHFMDGGKDLEERPEQLQIVLDKYMKRPEPEKKETQTPPAPLNLSDNELIERIRNSTQGEKFNSLWYGEWKGRYKSQSEADAALCSILAFWTQGDADRTTNLFLRSGLGERRKAQRGDYVRRTVEKAINTSGTYNPDFYKPEVTAEDRQGVKDLHERHAAEAEAVNAPYSDKTEPDGQFTAEDPKIEIRANDGPTEANEKEDKHLIFKAFNIKDYLTGGTFDNDIKYFKAYKDRKTGFKNIDQHLTLYPGLAALAGAASIGKTTFCVNLADNLVKRGETVLYFALEQEPIELVTKSLARRLIERDPLTRLTNIGIKDGKTSEALEAVKKEYAEDTGDRFVIIACDFSVTAGMIRDYTEDYIKRTGRRPVVIIDYLQLLAPPEDFRGDTRAIIDENIKTLKRMQLDNELFVLMISNINRASYETPPSYEDYKESSMIEFSADYLFELQPAIMETDSYYTVEYTNSKGRKVTRDTTKREKNKMLDEALSLHRVVNSTWERYRPKDVEFVALKNRNGRQRFKAFFKYDLQFDLYTEADAREWIDEPPEEPEDAEAFQTISATDSADKYGGIPIH